MNSFSRAADALGITQPAVSTQIKLLEDQLHARLIVRGRREVRLTLEGEIALRYADRILALHEEMQQAVNQLRDPASG